MCHYYHKPGHIKRDCRKLQSKKSQFAHVASSAETSSPTIAISVNEYAKLVHLQETVKQPTSPISVIVESGKTNTCLIFTSSKWVIDTDATDHMTSNPNLLSHFKSHTSITPIL